jgi:glycosyltransferase involved in cell wall biosynthesis
MALGTPVVAARMGSIPDVVVDGVSGLLFAPDDVESLAAAVARLRRDARLAEELAAGGRRHVERHFDETRSHERLRQEIERLLSLNGRSPRFSVS